MSKFIWNAMGLTVILGSCAAIGYYAAKLVGPYIGARDWVVGAMDSAILLNLSPIISAALGALVLYIAMRDDDRHQITNDGITEFEIYSAPLGRRVVIWTGWVFLILSAALSLVLVVRGEQ
jgi:hypothetical protein